jgi:hypothetical protein
MTLQIGKWLKSGEIQERIDRESRVRRGCRMKALEKSGRRQYVWIATIDSYQRIEFLNRGYCAETIQPSSVGQRGVSEIWICK